MKNLWLEIYPKESVEKIVEFYQAVCNLGLEKHSMGEGAGFYHILKRQGEKEGFIGLAQGSKEPFGLENVSLCDITVEDVDKATERAKERGAMLVLNPTTLPGMGRFSLLKDPVGVPFALITYEKGKGQSNERDLWLEFVCQDPQKSAHFYAEVCEASLSEMSMDYGVYYVLKNENAPMGFMGLMAKTPDAPLNGDFSLAYVTVKDVDAATDIAKKRGAHVCAAPFDVPNVGRMSVLTDPSGIPFGLATYF